MTQVNLSVARNTLTERRDWKADGEGRQRDGVGGGVSRHKYAADV